MIFGNWLWPLRRRELFSAASASLKIMASSASRSLIRHSTALSYLTAQVSTKASNAASASFLVSAIQISCSARLAFDCWLFGSLLRTLAVLCTQQRWPRVFGHTSSIACQKPSAVGDREFGCHRKPAPLQIKEELLPGLCTLAHAVDQADKLLLALGRGTNDDQQALRLVFEAGLHVDAVNPEVDVAFGREIALAPACVLVRPGVLEPHDGGGRKPAGVLAEQRQERFLEVAGGDALEIKDRDQHLEALRSARIGRQNRRRKADPLAAFADAVAHARAAHCDRTDPGHDLALGQMPVAHQPLAAVICQLVGMAAHKSRNLGLDRLRQQRSRAIAQNLGGGC